MNNREQGDFLNQNKIRKYKIAITAVIMVSIAGHLIYGLWFDKPEIGEVLGYNRTISEYNLINPLLIEVDLYEKAQSLENDLKEYLTEKQNNKIIDSVGIHFRDLESGYGFGVNENDQFIPASLLKLPTIITYYKLAESNQSILEKQIAYDGSVYEQIQTIAPDSHLKKGEKYTVNELAFEAISNSNNAANILLLDNLDRNEYLKVFDELGLTYTEDGFASSMTPKLYSNLLRILYNATYLNKEYSQKVLQLLSEADFDQGIIAGLPPGFTVANKFGERLVRDKSGNTYQLHDCGIIYSSHPYILCVMTSGKNLLQLKDVIKEISTLVYTEMKD